MRTWTADRSEAWSVNWTATGRGMVTAPLCPLISRLRCEKGARDALAWDDLRHREFRGAGQSRKNSQKERSTVADTALAG
ncbi:MAG: hypothetical protein ABI324_28040 [Ktedonobacteraceae bacterium]